MTTMSKEYKRAYYAANREKELARMKEYQQSEAGKAAKKRASDRYYDSEKGKTSKAQWEAANVDKRRTLEQSPEYKATRQAYRKTEARKAAQSRYQKAYPDRNAAKTARRRFTQAMATPAWLTEDDHWMLKEAFALARLRRRVCGGEWHVDHIVPLRGKTVTGLHVPWNLQVIPGAANRRKSNHHAQE